MNALLLLALSIAPGIAIAVYIYFKDKHEPEPIGLLLMSFLYGGISLFIAIGISIVINNFITIDEGSLKFLFRYKIPLTKANLQDSSTRATIRNA